MSVKIITTEHRVTAYLEGEIDHHTAADMRREIDRSVAMVRPQILRLDFNDVTFMDSSGVGLVMGRYRSMKPFNGRIIVSGLSPQCYKVMKLSGIEKLAEIEKKENTK